MHQTYAQKQMLPRFVVMPSLWGSQSCFHGTVQSSLRQQAKNEHPTEMNMWEVKESEDRISAFQYKIDVQYV